MPRQNNQSGNDESTKIKNRGYRPIAEGYTPDDEKDSLPDPPRGGSGEKGEGQSDDD